MLIGGVLVFVLPHVGGLSSTLRPLLPGSWARAAGLEGDAAAPRGGSRWSPYPTVWAPVPSSVPSSGSYSSVPIASSASPSTLSIASSLFASCTSGTSAPPPVLEPYSPPPTSQPGGLLKWAWGSSPPDLPTSSTSLPPATSATPASTATAFTSSRASPSPRADGGAMFTRVAGAVRGMFREVDVATVVSAMDALAGRDPRLLVLKHVLGGPLLAMLGCWLDEVGGCEAAAPT